MGGIKGEKRNGGNSSYFFIIDFKDWGVHDIARKSVPINVIVHYPKTEEGKYELAQRVADVHADMVNQYIKKLNCPSEQKVQLLDEVIGCCSD